MPCHHITQASVVFIFCPESATCRAHEGGCELGVKALQRIWIEASVVAVILKLQQVILHDIE